jgi:multidrug resistance protein
LTEFNETSEVLGSFSIVVWVLGFAVGPLFLGPLSEMFGRYPVMVASTWFMIAWILGCALSPSLNALIVFRLLAGIGGSASMTVAPAVCADMYPVETRVRSTAILTMAQTLAPTLGPLIGGFVGADLGWRWNYWLLLIAGGSSAALLTLTFKESYAPILLRQKTEKLRKEHGREDLRALMSKDISKVQLLKQAIIRPTKLLTRSVIASAVCIYVSVVYGCMYLWFTTIPLVYEDNYGWNSALTGLAYIGIGLGMLVSFRIIQSYSCGTNTQ